MSAPASLGWLKAMSLTKSLTRTCFASRRVGSPLVKLRLQSTFSAQERYWSRVAPWKNTSADEFINHRFQIRHTVNTLAKLERFLAEVLPDTLAPSKNPRHRHIRTKQDFINDANEGFKLAPMAIKLTPHVLSRIDWNNPLDDPIRRQFLTLRSGLITDHPELTLDSLNEEDDSPVPGLVHRYPGRALFLAMSICPVYCRFCTRSWAVGADTESVSKTPQRPSRARWERMFEHIETHPDIQDLVVSGGDTYQLPADQLEHIGERLLSIPHVRRIRLATKGLSVAPGRILDDADPWAGAVIALSQHGRRLGKQVALHTHFNHPNEITWIAEKAANKLFQEGVIVRNQSVLLRGVNDDEDTMRRLIKGLADINIQPYYVYQSDLVRGVEDLRTPLHVIQDLDKKIRGTISGFMVPSFVVDLPGGGGKRLASTCEYYDRETGVSYWRAPGLHGDKGRQIYTYYDPYPASLSAEQIKFKHEHTKRSVKEVEAYLRRKFNLDEPVIPEMTIDDFPRRPAAAVFAAPQRNSVQGPLSHPSTYQAPERASAHM